MVMSRTPAGAVVAGDLLDSRIDIATEATRRR